MPTELRETEEIAQRALGTDDIARVLDRLRIAPAEASPLVDIVPAAGDHTGVDSLASDEATCEAVARIASPARVVTLVTACPPDEATTFWFYGRRDEADLAFHVLGADGWHHVAWPIDRLAVLDLAAAPLELSTPTESFAISLALGRDELATLAAVCDAVQYDILQGALVASPSAAGPVQFSVDDLVALAASLRRRDDVRWMVSRAEWLAPIELDFSSSALSTGLDALLAAGLIVDEGGLFEPTPTLSRLCHTLGTSIGCSAITTRERDEAGAWSFEHVAVIRGPESLLLMEFSDVSATDFLLSIDDVTPAMAFEWLKSAVWLADVVSPVSDESPAFDANTPPAPVAVRSCPTCGRALKVGKRFCAQCGTATGEEPRP